MRQIVSLNSVKGILINKKEILNIIKGVCQEAVRKFSEIEDIKLIGSFAKGEETGLSDVDILIIANIKEKNPIERLKPYYSFFAEKIDISVDIMIADIRELELYEDMLRGSISYKDL